MEMSPGVEIEQSDERSSEIYVEDKFEECSLNFEDRIWRVQFEDRIWRKASFFWIGKGAQVGNLHLEVNFGASVDVGRIFYGTLQARGSHQTSIWEEGKTFYDMWNKVVRQIPSWQRSSVSQQRLRLRRLTLVKRAPKLRFEPVSFLFLACFSKNK